jgi:hypothetical protein
MESRPATDSGACAMQADWSAANSRSKEAVWLEDRNRAEIVGVLAVIVLAGSLVQR